MFYPNLDELSEVIIDLLADQFQVNFYDILGLNLETKRQLVKNAILWNKKKGTKAIVEEMLGVLYDSNCKVQEWFEYGGNPYYFKIIIDNVTFDEEALNIITLIINELKNVRSHLDNITVKLTVREDLYVGAVAVIHNKLSVKTNLTKVFKDKIYTANVVVIKRKTIVKGAVVNE